MAITATIVATDKDGKLYEIFQAENTDSLSDRSSYTVVNNEETTTFEVTANDGVAFRAVVNTIAKNITLFEQMQKIR
jgi:tRNA threonylcarbamoyladenosine modification (KEOPS) complex  Pcc1 subunit